MRGSLGRCGIAVGVHSCPARDQHSACAQSNNLSAQGYQCREGEMVQTFRVVCMDAGQNVIVMLVLSTTAAGWHVTLGVCLYAALMLDGHEW